jgi:hypothetical protein
MEPDSMLIMVIPQAVKKIDEYLDAQVAERYKDQPLAQDWARVAKLSEEVGEAVSELIAWTGQNPRKGETPASRARMLAELADVALTAVLAIQHFTKDLSETQAWMVGAQRRGMGRIQEAEGEGDGGATGVE